MDVAGGIDSLMGGGFPKIEELLGSVSGDYPLQKLQSIHDDFDGTGGGNFREWCQTNLQAFASDNALTVPFG